MLSCIIMILLFLVINIKQKENFMKKYTGFTLAETLIALAIIGVVAALTIPSLVEKYQERARVTALKKFYSVITQAVQMAVLEHGTPDMWGLTDDSSPMAVYVLPYLKHSKLCGTDEKSKCHTAQKLYQRNGNYYGPGIFNGSKNNGRTGLQLADGMVVGTYTQFVNTDTPDGGEICANSLGTGSATNICGEYMVDVNGSASPNTYGKDIFIFNLAKDGTVIPVGARNYTSSAYTFEGACLPETVAGLGCAAWVIENGNMDYWHCSDLAWDGKHKCSD